MSNVQEKKSLTKIKMNKYLMVKVGHSILFPKKKLVFTVLGQIRGKKQSPTV
jgi:hypothetical protein